MNTAVCAIIAMICSALAVMGIQTASMVGSMSDRAARSVTIWISTAIVLCGFFLLVSLD